MEEQNRECGTIAAYLADRAVIEARWADFAERSRLADIAANEAGVDPAGPRDYGLRAYREDREAAEARHFPRVDPWTGAGIDNPATLWRWLIDRLDTLRILVDAADDPLIGWRWLIDRRDTLRNTAGISAIFGSPRPFADTLATCRLHLNRLRIPAGPQPSLIQLSEVDAEAALWQIAHALRERETEAPDASGTEAPDGKASDPPAPSLSHRLNTLVRELRKNRARTQAALLEFMRDRDSASSEDIAEKVHGNDQTSEEAIRANVKRLNETLESESIPIRFRVGSGFVFKEEKPE